MIRNDILIYVANTFYQDKNYSTKFDWVYMHACLHVRGTGGLHEVPNNDVGAYDYDFDHDDGDDDNNERDDDRGD